MKTLIVDGENFSQSKIRLDNKLTDKIIEIINDHDHIEFEIKEVKALHFGIDDEYADKGIKSQGVLIADYEFRENFEQKNSGIFKGKLHSKWFLNSKNKIEYDNIRLFSDGYLNNAFVGIWQSYSTGKEKMCNWADYRVPITNRDFDLGAGEFSPNEKYYDKGWENYQNAWLYEDDSSRKEELNEWWK